MIRVIFLVAVFSLVGGHALAGGPTVEFVAPGAGQRGTEFTLRLVGARLGKPLEVLLYQPGVVCSKLAGVNDNETTLTLKAAGDCPLGEHAFRLRTAGGLSELKTFRVTPFPLIEEIEPNDQKPQRINLNVTVTGSTESAGADRFVVTLKKGQRLSAEAEGVRLGGELTDTALTITGPDGKPLASVDDTALFRQDPFLSIRATADGDHIVEVRDTNYGGGDNHLYLLHVGTFARPAAVYPAGGEAGRETTIRLLGEAGESSETITLPAADRRFEYRPRDAEGPAAPTPNPFRLSAFPNVLETEPNDEPSLLAKPAAWPVAFNGIIDKPGDADHFAFLARRGDEVDVRAFAFQIGSPLDTVVAVLDARGELIAGNDDDETHDSRVRVMIPADGQYFVRVTDKRRQGGPRFIYRVELSKPQTGLALFLAPTVRKSQDRQVISIPRGNRTAVFLAVRRDGFDGPVRIETGELPAGVKVTIPEIPAGEYFLPVVFEASPDAPISGRLLSLRGLGGDAKNPVAGEFSQSINLIPGPGDSSLHSVDLNKLAIAVTDEAPYSVSIVTPPTALPVDGTLALTLRVNRSAEFKDPIDVSFLSLPPGVEAPTSVSIPADKSEATVVLVGHPSAETGDWKLLVEAKPGLAGKGDRDPLMVGNNGLGTPAPGSRRPRRRAIDGLPPVASAVSPIRVAGAIVRGKIAPVAAEQGKRVTIVCELEGEVGEFTAKLDGLPPRATAKPVVVKAGARQVAFDVSIDPTTPAGEHRSLVCELAGQVGGREIIHRVGRGGILKLDAPGALRTDKTGKPLSPLEALRLEQKK